MLRRAAKVRVVSTIISLPADFRNALVHLSFRGFRFILNFLDVSTAITYEDRVVSSKLWLTAYIFMTFASAKFEDSGIVAHKGDPLRGVAGLGAEVARLDPIANI